MRALFVSKNLIGDGLYIGPALRAWILEKDKEGIVLSVYLQTLPDHVATLYQGMVRDLLGDGHHMISFKTVYERPEGIFDFEHTFDVSKAFELCDKNKYHLAEGYAELLGVKLEGEGNNRLKPIYIPDDVLVRLVHDYWVHLSELKGCILVSMFSASCQSRDAKTKGLPPNKMLPWSKWKPLLELLKHDYPQAWIRFLGAPTDVLPEEFEVYGDPMFGIPLNRLALIMQKAKLLVTIDNGMAHLGASQETPTWLMYPRCLGPHYILPVGNPNLEWVHMEPNYVNPAQLVHSLRYAINKFKDREKAA